MHFEVMVGQLRYLVGQENVVLLHGVVFSIRKIALASMVH